QLRATLGYLNDKLTNIGDNIKRRYKELGYDVNVKDLAYYFDWDGDGIAGNEIDENITDYVDKTAISVPKEGGDFTVNILCKSQLSLTNPFTADAIPTVGQYYNEGLYDGSWKPEEMSYTNSIEGKVLKIHVDKTKSFQPLNSFIVLFDARGKNVANITITQEGDTSLKPTTPPMLGDTGKKVVENAFFYLNDGCSSIFDASWNLGNYTINSNDNNVRNAWSRLYASVNQLLTIKNADKHYYDCYSPYLDSYLALNFLYLTSYWGDVPYFREPLASDYNASDMTRKSVKDIYNSLEADLKAAMPFLEDKSNASIKEDINEKFFVPKDVARILLAQIYVAQKKYEEAIPYIENIMSSNHYALVNGEDTNG
ncbi:MAG: RagB/SusD family nutrient uptake outer membrane protein, partial [Bacteroidaceae bacterium]|nr:RagB/SusD family nutrient uptake outer membrane protein [Bacteroidaceae bacterium]